MATSLVTWSCMAALFLIILFVRYFRLIIHSANKHHLFHLGSEREEIFVPGDRLITDDNKDYDDSDDF